MKMLTKDGHKTPAHDTLSAVYNHPNETIVQTKGAQDHG